MTPRKPNASGEQPPSHRVSVIVPAQNAAGTLGATLASLAGDAAAIGDVVVVDDGSSDNTAEIARTAGARYSLPVRVVAGERRGPGAARNLGMRAARGDWLYFIDADDELVEGGLVALRDRLRADATAGIAVGGFIRRVAGRRDKVCLPGRYAARPLENARRYLTDRVRSIAMGSALVRRSAIHDAQFPEDLVYEEDTCFWVMAVARAKVVTVGSPVLIYNVSLERSDERFAASARRNYLNTSRSFRRLIDGGMVEGDYLRIRKQLIALKTARVFYQRGDWKAAARFLGLVSLSRLSLIRQWQALRYAARIAVIRRLPNRVAGTVAWSPLSGTGGSPVIDARNLARLTINR